jgi:hypothetical protein
MGWCTAGHDREPDGGVCSFQLEPLTWELVASRARALHTTPYVFVLTCLQLALARTAGLTRLLVHTIVSRRDHLTERMIGNFQSLVRVDAQLDPDATFESAIAGTALAVAEAVEHSVMPASLALSAMPTSDPASDPLAGVRFYMFSNHAGPRFAGVRRRRFRLHGPPSTALTVSCIYGPGGRQDFVLSSTVKPREEIQRVSSQLQWTIEMQIDADSAPEDFGPGDAAIPIAGMT